MSLTVEGAYSVLSVLIQAGAEVDARDDEGRTPLMLAAENENPEVLMILIEAGAKAEDLTTGTGLFIIDGLEACSGQKAG